MKESEFENWCRLKEPKLTKYRVADIINERGLLIFFPFLFAYVALIGNILGKLFSPTITFLILFASSFLLGYMFAFLFRRSGNFPMNRINILLVC